MPSADTVIAEMEAAAERVWGAERRDALAGPLRRAAEALAKVAAFPLPPGVEPLPTGPMTNAEFGMRSAE